MKCAIRRRLACGCFLLLPLLASAQETGTKPAESRWWAETGQPETAPAKGAAGISQETAASQAPASATVSDTSVQARLAGPVSEKDFDCVEVRRFEVGSGFITSKQDARAATIPAEKLGSMQRAVAGQIPEKIHGFRSTLVAEGSPQCPDPARALVLSGRVTDFKEGSQALRYWVGFGAGAQKFGVLVRATRKSDGALVGEGEVIDRKVGGWVGGQAEKGLEDFAEKVAEFLKRSLQAK